ASVTADTVSYAAFNKNGAQTFIAYNPGAAARDVTFRDAQGTVLLKMTVPGRTLRAARKDGMTVAQQTTPNLALQTPLERFFFSRNDPGTGDQPFLHGNTGRDERSIDLPAAGTAVTYKITGLTGTLKGPDAQAFFSLWLDPQTRSGVPAIKVHITYDRFGNG